MESFNHLKPPDIEQRYPRGHTLVTLANEHFLKTRRFPKFIVDEGKMQRVYDACIGLETRKRDISTIAETARIDTETAKLYMDIIHDIMANGAKCTALDTSQDSQMKMSA